MLVLRRSLAALLTLLLVQLSLVGSDVSCVAHDEGASMPLAHGGMATNGDAGMDPSHAPDSRPDDCTTPWVPGSCSMPVSCTAPSLPTSATATLADIDPQADRWADLSLTAPAPLIPPDPPPPRA